jgi:hypothetical protein
MYLAIVLLLLFVFPVISIFVEIIGFHSSVGIVPLIGKWFVFWGVGVRLLTAGVSQIVRPEFTAKAILGMASEESLLLVNELGFGNLSIGILGVCTIVMSGWTLPAALVGGLFYGFAGFRHVFKNEKNLKETIATYSDLFIFAVLLIYFVNGIGR